MKLNQPKWSEKFKRYCKAIENGCILRSPVYANQEYFLIYGYDFEIYKWVDYIEDLEDGIMDCKYHYLNPYDVPKFRGLKEEAIVIKDGKPYLRQVIDGVIQED